MSFIPPQHGFEPATPAIDRPQTLALDLSATRIGLFVFKLYNSCMYIGHKPGDDFLEGSNIAMTLI
jgi:hypothetical protein